MDDGIGLAEVLLGLPGFEVLDAVEADDELVVSVQSIATRAFCRRCGLRAEAQDRLRVDLRDLPCFGRPTRLVWSKRRWRCPEPACEARTWTEHSEHIDAQVVLTRRAGPRRAGRSVPTPVRSRRWPASLGSVGGRS